MVHKGQYRLPDKKLLCGACVAFPYRVVGTHEGLQALMSIVISAEGQSRTYDTLLLSISPKDK